MCPPFTFCQRSHELTFQQPFSNLFHVCYLIRNVNSLSLRNETGFYCSLLSSILLFNNPTNIIRIVDASMTNYPLSAKEIYESHSPLQLSQQRFGMSEQIYYYQHLCLNYL